MGASDRQAIEAAKKDIATVVARLTEVANIAVATLTEEEIKAGFAAAAREAPQWTHLVERVVGAAARSETQKPTQVNNSLNLVLVQKAATVADWGAQVAEFKKSEAKRELPPIDVPAVVKDSE